MWPKRRERGFTLVEVLVALVVTSLLIAIVMNAAVTARERQNIADQRIQAVSLARSLGEEALSASLVVGQRRGQMGQLRWVIDERIEIKDPRGFFALTVIAITIANDRKVRLFSGELRWLKPVPAT